MVDRYKPTEIEPKWQRRWAEDKLYKSVIEKERPGFYFLTMLPYTSGNLHIGHWYAMAPSDVKARFLRMQGHNVMFPIGFDAFGLPAENAAIRRGIHPFQWTMSNIERMREQLKQMGATFDWDREAITCVPEYYKWSQWFFLQFYKHGLAYRAQSPVDFCPTCNTTLAREQVWGEDRHCERCETPVIKKDLEQWFFRITNYADELLDFSQIDWPERVETMQRNWIGRSEGADVVFQIEGSPAFPPRVGGDRGGAEGLVVFTTRPDTLWGATFMVLAPEHPLVDKLTTPEYQEAVTAYRYQASRQSEIERLAADKEKTGVFIGAYAINPVNDERIPIWIADYVLMTYGTGAIMAVPGHDERDFAFAIKYGLPIIPVIDRPDGVARSVARPGTTRDGLAEALTAAGIPFEEREGALYVTMSRDQVNRYIELAQEHLQPGSWTEMVGARWAFVFDDDVVPFDSVAADRAILARCHELEPAVRDRRTVMELLAAQPFYSDVLLHTEYSTMINSGPLTGTPGDKAVARTIEWLAERDAGQFAVNYRLRDWLISRQRYWGAPIPIVYCPTCGTVPVPEDDLPVLLPEDAEFLPTGESPLKYHEGFLHTTCPRCGGPAERETDTMDTFMCSSWYQWRYLSPHYDEGPFDPREAAYWLPVDLYTGGIEHATMHLIYTRFFTKACRDIGLVDHDEPMLKLHNQGIILGEDSEKMSKSRGNVVDPDDLVQRYGADTVRTYLMFIGPWEDGGPWNSRGIEGVARFYNRVWNLVLGPLPLTPSQREGGSSEGTASEKDVAALRRITHKTIRKVTADLESFRFNTMVAALMEFNNYLVKVKSTPVAHTPAWDEAVETLLLLLAPSAPHVIEELWARLGKPHNLKAAGSIHQQPWPQWDEALAADEVITLPVQVNGKVRARLQVPADVTEEQARELALADEGVQRHIAGKQVRRVIYVPGRLVNVVAR